ncbi:MAG: hypothetical protein ACTSRG_18610 [Candidatus Helarchaeota archaeon]
MSDNMMLMKKYKKRLFNIPEIKLIIKLFQRERGDKNKKIIENILRETYYILINQMMDENKKKIQLHKCIMTVFIDQRIFYKIRNKSNLQSSVKSAIDSLLNILIEIEHRLTPIQIKNIFDLIICSFHQPR